MVQLVQVLVDAGGGGEPGFIRHWALASICGPCLDRDKQYGRREIEQLQAGCSEWSGWCIGAFGSKPHAAQLCNTGHMATAYWAEGQKLNKPRVSMEKKGSNNKSWL